MAPSSAHEVGLADSYARRTADTVVAQLHLPHVAQVEAPALRLTRLGKGATRHVDVAAQVRSAPGGVLLTAVVSRADVEPGRWQLRLREPDGSGYRRVRARLLVRPEQPVALLVGPTPATSMPPPKPRRQGSGAPAASSSTVRGSVLRRAVRAVRRRLSR